MSKQAEEYARKKLEREGRPQPFRATVIGNAMPPGGATTAYVDASVSTVKNTTVATTNSLTGGGDLSADRTLSLVGDVSSPGSNYLYGTDSSGTRGWYSQAGTPPLPNTPSYTTLRSRTPLGQGDAVFVRGRVADRDGGEGTFVYNASPTGAAYVAVQAAGSGYPSMPGRVVLTNADGKHTNVTYVVDDDGTVVQAVIDQVTSGGSAYTTDYIDVTVPDTQAQLVIDLCFYRAVAGDVVSITVNSVTTNFTFVSSGAVNPQVNVGANITGDANNLRDAINTFYSGTITAATYTGQGSAIVYLTVAAAGTGGNANYAVFTPVDTTHFWRLSNINRQFTNTPGTSLNFSGGGTGAILRCYRDNGGTHITPPASSGQHGRWERSVEGRPNWCDARWFGWSSSSSDNTAAIMTADSASWYYNNTLYLPGAGGNSSSAGANFTCTGKVVILSSVVADCNINSSLATQNADCVTIWNPKVIRGPRGVGLNVTAARNLGNVIDDGAALAIGFSNTCDIDVGATVGSHITTGLRFYGSDSKISNAGGSCYFGKIESRQCSGNRHSVHFTQTYIQRSIDDGNSLRCERMYFREINGTVPAAAGTDKWAFMVIEAPGARLPTASGIGPKWDSNTIWIGDMEVAGVTVDEYHAVEIYAGSGNRIICDRFDVQPGTTAGQKRVQAGALLYVSPRDWSTYNNVFEVTPDAQGVLNRTNLRAAAGANTLWIEAPDPAVQPAMKRSEGCAVKCIEERQGVQHTLDISFADSIIGWNTEAASKYVIPSMVNTNVDGYIGKTYASILRRGFIDLNGLAVRGDISCPYVDIDTTEHKNFNFAIKSPQAGPRSIWDAGAGATKIANASLYVIMYDFRGRIIPSGGTSGSVSPSYGNARVFADALVAAVDDVFVVTVGLRTFVWRCITAGTTSGATVPTYPGPFVTTGTATLEFCCIQNGDVWCDSALFTPQQGYAMYRIGFAGNVSFSPRVAKVRFVLTGGITSGLSITTLDTSHRGPFQQYPVPVYSGWVLAVPKFGRFNLGQVIPNASVSSNDGWICATPGWLAYKAWTTGTTYGAGDVVSSGGNIFECIAGGASLTFTGPAAGANADRVIYDVCSLGSAATVTASAGPSGFTATYDVKRVISAPLGYADVVDTIGTLSIANGATTGTLSLSGATPYIYEYQLLRLTRTDGNGAYGATITFHSCGGTLEKVDTTPLSTVDPNTISGTPTDRLLGSDGFVWKSLGAQAVIQPYFAGYRTVKVTATTDSPGTSGDDTCRWLTNASACTVTLPQISTVSLNYTVVIYQSSASANPTVNTTGGDTVSGSITWGADKAARYIATAATVWTATQVY